MNAMKEKPKKQVNRPFKDLAAQLERKKISLAPYRYDRPAQKTASSPFSEEKESALFLQAMADVKPLIFNNTGWQSKPPSIPFNNDDEDQATMAELHKLIQYGQGFVVSLTPEYMESATPGVSADTLRRLHQGRYAIQDYVDLHGLVVQEAQPVLERFIKRSIERGYRAVLIVHGRGLTSPKEPVLKQNVYAWLTRGRLRKWVIALTSARSCDGGAGATYVLLRQRPLTKRRRKSQ
jgi:DNA-nicking Smr family endonuclease